MELTQKKRGVAATMAGLLLCSALAGTTIAYLTAQTSTTTNTFVAAPGIIHNNQFSVDESKANLEGGAYSLDETVKVQENTYGTVLPSMTLPKDPSVTADVEEGVSAYIFMEVQDTTKAPGVTQGNLSWAIDDANWNEVSGTTNVFVYKNPVIGKDGIDLSAVNVLKNKKVLASDILMDVDKDSDGLQMGTLSFKAYAIQSAGFDSPAAAWKALNPLA